MSAAKKIAVAGATGRLGRHIVDLFERDGHDVVAMSRSQGVDVVTGQGLDAALAGVEIVIDAASGSSPDAQQASDHFTAAAHNLQQASDRAGVERIVVISIVGCDRFSGGGAYGGYYAAKIAQERAMLAGPVPVQIVRATQFHEFVGQLVDLGAAGRRELRPADPHPADRSAGSRRGGRGRGDRAPRGRPDGRGRRPAGREPRRSGERPRGAPRRPTASAA